MSEWQGGGERTKGACSKSFAVPALIALALIALRIKKNKGGK